MEKVRDILDFMEAIAPSSLKMEWDNVGLLCGGREKTVRKILVALDPFPHVCQEAIDWGADLIVTHHPLIFQPAKNVVDDNAVGKAIFMLVGHDISAVNAHTNLDVAPGGVNDTLAEIFGLSDIAPLPTAETPAGLVRCGYVPEQTLEEFLPQVKKRLSCPGLRYISGGRPVRFVAVGGGACGSELAAVAEKGCDTFITSDVRYNQFWDAVELGINLIDAGHFYTENPVCSVLAERLQQAFPDITVKVSENHRDPMKFFL